MEGLPGPGIELVSPELAGGFLTTGPPGESQLLPFKPSFAVTALASLQLSKC